MRYKKIEPVSLEYWQTVVKNSPSATFYHTPAWANIMCQTFPRWENMTFGLEFEDGNRVIFPLFRRKIISSFPFYWYESIIPGAYGGPLFDSVLSHQHFEAIERELGCHANITLVSNPFLDWCPKGKFSQNETFIQIIRLSPDFGKIWKSYSKGRRHTINYAKKQGVVVKEVNFVENFQEYYTVYLRQLTRWGRNATDNYPLRLFENLANISKINPGIRLWAAWLDNKMISGLIVFYHNKHLVTWHGATLDEYFEYRPVDILYSTVIEHACEAGFDVFDFANSGGHQNVVTYKERFGAIRQPLYIFRRRNIGGFIYRAERHIKNYLAVCPED